MRKMSRTQLCPVIISVKYFHFHDHSGKTYVSGCKACKLDRLPYYDKDTFRSGYYHPDPISCDDCVANFYALKSDIVVEELSCIISCLGCWADRRTTICPICRNSVLVQETGHILVKKRDGQLVQMKDVTTDI